ncbi:MAG: T9SS type A sorting domain-containing protein [Bacteroidota bacterium]|nr:T9SS type A sorting domain-containing protein [Bacteroidota bacterium]
MPINNYTTLKVYDGLGREVATLVDGYKEAGYYEVTWDTMNIPSGVSARGGYASGVYFYKLTAGQFTSVKKMIMMR